MTQSYEQIQKQIEALQRQAAKLRDEEIAGVVERIKVAIAHYGLTMDQLGFATNGTSKGKAKSKDNRQDNGQIRLWKSGAAKGAMPPKFADDKGNVWSGRGPRPHWLRNALAAGDALADFATNGIPKVAGRAVSQVADTAPAESSASIPVPVRATKQYQDGKGNVWSGRGPKPRWFKDALAGGATAEQLLAS